MVSNPVCFPDGLPERQRVFQLPKNMDAGHHVPHEAKTPGPTPLMRLPVWRPNKFLMNSSGLFSALSLILA